MIQRDVERADKVDAAPLADGQHLLITQGLQHARSLVGVRDIDRLAAIPLGPLDDPELYAGRLHGTDHQALALCGQGRFRCVEVAVLFQIVFQHDFRIQRLERGDEGGSVIQSIFEFDFIAALKMIL